MLIILVVLVSLIKWTFKKILILFVSIGIHRPVAASVKSGYSKSSRVSNATSRAPGSEYKAQKAGGDLKKQGKHEPYVYMSISRNQLNRRKRKSGNSQFKNVGGKSTKGNKGGSKSKKRT